MMKRILGYCLMISALLLLSNNSFAQTSKIIRSTVEPKMTGVATLYALDPLAQTFCFRDGQDGFVVQENEIKNRCSDLDFNGFNVGNFTTGIEGGRIGTVIDLGSADELKLMYAGSKSGVSRGQIFVSLRVENESVVIFKDKTTVQPLEGSAALFAVGKPNATAPVKLGHIYLVRITDRHDKSFQLLAKMIVVAYVPNESVSIRWEVL